MRFSAIYFKAEVVMRADSSNFDGILSELTQFPIFSGMSHDSLRWLCREGVIRVNRHRDLVFELGAPAIYFGIVLSGAYKLSRLTPAGEDSVIHFSSPGDVVAALVMAQENPVYPVSVCAMGPSRILLIPRSVYVDAWISHPRLVLKIQGLLTTRMARLQNQKMMQRAPLSAKIAAFLLQLVSRTSDSSELEVPLPLTRKEIAAALGVTVESVIRVMSEWEKHEFISTQDQQIKILRPDQMIRQIDHVAD